MGGERYEVKYARGESNRQRRLILLFRSPSPDRFVLSGIPAQSLRPSSSRLALPPTPTPTAPTPIHIRCQTPSTDSPPKPAQHAQTCPTRPSHPYRAHLNERLVVQVEELVELDTAVGVLLEGTGRLLGGCLLSGGEVGLDHQRSKRDKDGEDAGAQDQKINPANTRGRSEETKKWAEDSVRWSEDGLDEDELGIRLSHAEKEELAKAPVLSLNSRAIWGHQTPGLGPDSAQILRQDPPHHPGSRAVSSTNTPHRRLMTVPEVPAPSSPSRLTMMSIRPNGQTTSSERGSSWTTSGDPRGQRVNRWGLKSREERRSSAVISSLESRCPRTGFMLKEERGEESGKTSKVNLRAGERASGE